MTKRRSPKARWLDATIAFFNNYRNEGLLIYSIEMLRAQFQEDGKKLDDSTIRNTLRECDHLVDIPLWGFAQGLKAKQVAEAAEKFIGHDYKGIHYSLFRCFQETQESVNNAFIHTNPQPIRHVIKHFKSSAIKLPSGEECSEQLQSLPTHQQLFRRLQLALPRKGFCELKWIWLRTSLVLHGYLREEISLTFAFRELNTRGVPVLANRTMDQERSKRGKERTLLEKLKIVSERGLRVLYSPRIPKTKVPTRGALRAVTDIERLVRRTNAWVTAYGDKNKRWYTKKRELCPWRVQLYLEKQVKRICAKTQTLAVKAGYTFSAYFQHLLLAIGDEVRRMVREIYAL